MVSILIFVDIEAVQQLLLAIIFSRRFQLKALITLRLFKILNCQTAS